MRETLGLTQAQFAQLLGVHWVTVSKWERGELTPAPYQAALIAQFGQAGRTHRGIGLEVGELLVAAGVAAALFLLLKAAFDKGKK